MNGKSSERRRVQKYNFKMCDAIELRKVNANAEANANGDANANANANANACANANANVMRNVSEEADWLPVKRGNRCRGGKGRVEIKGILKNRIPSRLSPSGVVGAKHREVKLERYEAANHNRWELLTVSETDAEYEALDSQSDCSLAEISVEIVGNPSNPSSEAENAEDEGGRFEGNEEERQGYDGRGKSVSFCDEMSLKFFNEKKNARAVAKSLLRTRRLGCKDDMTKNKMRIAAKSSSSERKIVGERSMLSNAKLSDKQKVKKLLVRYDAEISGMSECGTVRGLKVQKYAHVNSENMEWIRSCDAKVIKSAIFSEKSSKSVKGVVMGPLQQNYVCDEDGCGELSFATKKEWTEHLETHKSSEVKSPGAAKDFKPVLTDTSTQQEGNVGDGQKDVEAMEEEEAIDNESESLDETRAPPTVSAGYRDDTRHLCPPGQPDPDNSGNKKRQIRVRRTSNKMSYAAVVAGPSVPGVKTMTAQGLMDSVLEMADEPDVTRQPGKKRKVDDREKESDSNDSPVVQVKKKPGRAKMSEDEKVQRAMEKAKIKQIAKNEKLAEKEREKNTVRNQSKLMQGTIASRGKQVKQVTESKDKKPKSLRAAAQEKFSKKLKEEKELEEKLSRQLNLPKAPKFNDSYKIPKKSKGNETSMSTSSWDDFNDTTDGEETEKNKYKDELMGLLEAAEERAKDLEERAEKAERAQVMLQSQVDDKQTTLTQYEDDYSALMVKETKQSEEISELRLSLAKATKKADDLLKAAEADKADRGVDQELVRILEGVVPGETEKFKERIAKTIKDLKDQVKRLENEKEVNVRNSDQLADFLADRNKQCDKDTKELLARDRLILVLNRKIPCEKLEKGIKCEGDCGQKHPKNKVAERNKARVDLNQPCKFYYGLGKKQCKPPAGAECRYSHEMPKEKGLRKEYKKLVAKYKADFAKQAKEREDAKSTKKSENKSSKSVTKSANKTDKSSTKKGKKSVTKSGKREDKSVTKSSKKRKAGGESFIASPDSREDADEKSRNARQILDGLLKHYEDSEEEVLSQESESESESESEEGEVGSGSDDDSSGNESGSVNAESTTSETNDSAIVISAAKKRKIADQVFASDKYQAKMMTPKMTPSTAAKFKMATSAGAIKKLLNKNRLEVPAGISPLRK